MFWKVPGFSQVSSEHAHSASPGSPTKICCECVRPPSERACSPRPACPPACLLLACPPACHMHRQPSPVEQILDKEEYTLEELLDEDDIIQECKSLNSRLVAL